jgi:hypothetical protein
MPDTNWYLNMHVDADTMTDSRVRSGLEQVGSFLRGEDATEWNRLLTNYKGTGPLALRLPARVLSENTQVITALQTIGTTLRGDAQKRWINEIGEQLSSHGMSAMLNQGAHQSGGARSTPGETTTR